MHSTEHILNQTMVRMFNKGRSFSAHIEKKKSNLDIREEFYPKEEAEKKINLSKLPEDAGDNIRIIHIGDYDSCPCIGNHVKNTNEIGEFRIISTNYESGVLRIRFKLKEILL